MGKIIGKSALTFAGLVVAGWLMNMLADLILHTEINGNWYYGITKMTLLSYLPWLVLALCYAFALFLLFRKEKHRTLIMVLNSMAVIVVDYSFYLFSIFVPIPMVYLALAAGVPVMVLAVMLKWLFPGTEKRNLGFWNSTQGAASALCKSILFLGVMVGLTFAEFEFIGSKIHHGLRNNLSLPLFYGESMVMGIAVLAASLLYGMTAGHKRRFLIIMVNAMIMAGTWSIILMRDFICDLLGIPIKYFYYLSTNCGNTALVAIILAFAFRVFEKMERTEVMSMKMDTDK